MRGSTLIHLIAAGRYDFSTMCVEQTATSFSSSARMWNATTLNPRSSATSRGLAIAYTSIRDGHASPLGGSRASETSLRNSVAFRRRAVPREDLLIGEETFAELGVIDFLNAGPRINCLHRGGAGALTKEHEDGLHAD